MERIITLRYHEEGQLPDASRDELEALQANVLETVEQYDGGRIQGSIRERRRQCICEWEAPDVDTVVEIFEESGSVDVAPSDEIIEVDQVLPL